MTEHAVEPAVGSRRPWRRVRDRRKLRDRLQAMSDFALFFAIVLAVTVGAVALSEQEEPLLFKFVAVLFFSMLPALIYLQFASNRVHAVWDEYVISLFQLRLDNPGYLPEPPQYSEFHPQWARHHPDAHGDHDEHKTLYQQKFEALFGPVKERGADRSTATKLKSENALPVALATFIIALGWVLVAQPESVWGQRFLPQFESTGLPPLPVETVAFGFLGAYFYVLQMLVRRYFQSDLKSNAYLHATMRIVMAILLAWTIDPLLSDQSQAMRSAIAFTIGVFPLAGWQILQGLVALPARRVVKSLQPNHPLDGIDGLNVWYESRLLELGIEDMQNLATANIVDVMLNTRIPVGRLIDWIDQALLILHVEHASSGAADKDLDRLRRYGICTATSLEEALGFEGSGARRPGASTELDGLLNHDGDPGSVMLSIARTLQTERNLQFVRAWKCYRARGGRGTARAAHAARNGDGDRALAPAADIVPAPGAAG